MTGKSFGMHSFFALSEYICVYIETINELLQFRFCLCCAEFIK